jgi:hypothetical protein
MTTQKRENKRNRHRIHTNETYRSRAVGSSSIEGETGDNRNRLKRSKFVSEKQSRRWA